MKTILIIDDDKAYRELLKKKLEPAGYTIVEANEGKKALNIMKLQGSNIHLILLDLHMPEMDGQTFYYELKNKLHLETPIIIITNEAIAEYPSGIRDVITKTDTSLEELEKKIKEYFV